MRVGQQRKRDTSEAQIVKALRKIGVQVFAISGRGVPDLLTFHRGRWGVIEVKTKGGRLTDAQKNTRVLAPFPVVETVDEAIALFQ
jgi:Holliday junction resolvase